MKRIVFILTTIFIIFSLGRAFGQTQKGNIELSMSLSLCYYEYEEEYWRRNGDYYIINIPIRFGYFITDELEFEPELTLTISDGDTGYLLIGNFAYNFKTDGKITPFILAGAGFGNAKNTCSIAFRDDDIDRTAYNLGVGLKTFITPSVALRTEYRFTHYFADEKDYYWSYIIHDVHNIFLGFSIFFNH